jgi:hypothetical protein
MAYKEIAQLTLTQNSAVVSVGSSELLTDVVKGDYLEVAGQLAKQVLSVDQAGREITLSSVWLEATVAGVKAVIRPTSADFRLVTKEVAALNSMATQSIGLWDALTNTITTVTITLPDLSTVDIPSIPKAIQDASDLQSNALAAIDLMGDAPALAQQVADDKDTVYSYLVTGIDVEIETGVYSLLHHSTKAINAKNAAETAQGLSENARDGSVIAKNTSVDAKNASQTAQGLSEVARDGSITAKDTSIAAKNASQTAQGLSEDASYTAAEWADKAGEVEPGRRSAKHWAGQAELITDTANYVLKSQTINGVPFNNDITLTPAQVGAMPNSYEPEISDVINLQTTLDSIQETAEFLEIKINRARRLALAGI